MKLTHTIRHQKLHKVTPVVKPQATKDKKCYFENLDSIRFIAASMVFLQHGISGSYDYLPQDTVFMKILRLISNGGTGVSIFFVLSGFLITYLLITEYELNQKILVRDFYIRRILRIWPLYFAVVFIAFIIYPFSLKLAGIEYQSDSNVFYHLFFISNFDAINILNSSGQGQMIQGITWSVSIEEQFYLFWPLLFAFIPKKYWILELSLVIIASILFRLLHHKEHSTQLYFHTMAVQLDLGIGGLFAYLIKINCRIRVFFENSGTRNHIIFIGTAILLLYLQDSSFGYEYGYAIIRVFISVSLAFVICLQAFTKKESILNLGNLSFARKWGKYTYGIYLLHPVAIVLAIFIAQLLHVSRDNFINVFGVGILSFIITLLLSKLSYQFYESKFLIIKNRFKVV